MMGRRRVLHSRRRFVPATATPIRGSLSSAASEDRLKRGGPITQPLPDRSPGNPSIVAACRIATPSAGSRLVTGAGGSPEPEAEEELRREQRDMVASGAIHLHEAPGPRFSRSTRRIGEAFRRQRAGGTATASTPAQPRRSRAPRRLRNAPTTGLRAPARSGAFARCCDTVSSSLRQVVRSASGWGVN